MRMSLFVLLVLSGASLRADEIEGFMEPYETVDIAAAEAGILRNIAVSQGQRVTKGALMAALDARVLEATLAAARARAEAKGPTDSAQAVLESRERRLVKLQSLVTDGHASTEEIERAKLDVALAKADVVTAKEQTELNQLEVKRIEAQIEQRSIRSSIDGEVTRVHKRVGESVTHTDAIVATVVNLSRLRVRFHIPTRQAAQLSVGQSISVHVVDKRRVAVGAIEFVSPVTESKSGTVRIEVVIDNTRRTFRSGLRCMLDGTPRVIPTTE